MVTWPSPVAGHTEMALFAFAPRGFIPQFTNLYHFHVADTPLDASISVYFFEFHAQPYFCPRSYLNLKKKPKNFLSFFLTLAPFLHKHFFLKFWSTRFYSFLKKKKTLFFRAVWDSQQTWAESTESSHIPTAPQSTASSKPEQYICYNWRTYTDTLLSPKAYSLQ